MFISRQYSVKVLRGLKGRTVRSKNGLSWTWWWSVGVWWWDIFRMTTYGRPTRKKSECWLACGFKTYRPHHTNITEFSLFTPLPTKHVRFITIRKMDHTACRRQCSLFERTKLYWLAELKYSCDAFRPNQFHSCICKEFLLTPPPPPAAAS